MASTAVKTERLQELRAAVALRHREVEELERRKEVLVSDVERSPTTGTRRKHAQDDDDEELFAQHSVLRFCAGSQSAQLVAATPPEQMGNIVCQLDAACAAMRLATASRAKDAQDLSLQLAKLEEDQLRIAEQIKLFADITGLPTTAAGAKASPNQKAYKCAPVGAYFDPRSIERPKEVIAELKVRMLRVQKETRVLDVLRQKNVRTIESLKKSLEKRKGVQEQIGSTKNEIKCLYRDIAEKKKELERLLTEHELLDHQLTANMKPQSTSKRILDRDVTVLKQQVEDCVEGERRVQDRVIKAQEYRIQQLEKRLASAKRALQNHKLEGQVARVIAANLQRSPSPPQDSSVATPERSRSEERYGGGSSPNSPLALDVPNTVEELYDIDRIIPPQETVHAALYSLFVSEKEALALQVHNETVTLKEKDDALDALADQVAQLTLEYDEAQALLMLTTSEADTQEEYQRQKAISDVLVQRDAYKKLLKQKIRIRKEGQSNWSATHSSGGTSPHQSPPATERSPSVHTAQPLRSSLKQGASKESSLAGASMHSSSPAVRNGNADTS